MDRNIRIAKKLVRLAKSLVAFNEHVDENGIRQIRDDFESALKDPKKLSKPIEIAEYKRWLIRQDNEDKKEVMDSQSIHKCLEAFDKLMNDFGKDGSSLQTQYASDMADRYKECLGGVDDNDTVFSSNILRIILQDASGYLRLKDFVK